ncbi:MAG: XkdQ/YqbQ family protein [Carboxydocellales bacterium]
MTLDLQTNGLSLRELLAGPPRITDSLEAVCRTLEIPVQNPGTLKSYLGKPVELWYGGKRWFYGILFKKNSRDTGEESYAVYDPLYYFKKNPDDYYIKNMTATQGFKYLADQVGVKVCKLANTGAVFKALYYQGAEPDKIGIDLLVRTADANGKKFWFRYQPDYDNDGLILFERVVPSLVWAFQAGINLTSASIEESIDEIANVVKLVNRETGKVVTKVDAASRSAYGTLKYFEEVDKDKAKTMEKDAEKKLAKLSKVSTVMSLDGVNPNQTMPQFFSGDVIYAEERRTKILGAYFIKDVTHTFVSDNLVQITAEIQRAPEVPDIQYEDATQAPESKKSSSSLLEF